MASSRSIDDEIESLRIAREEMELTMQVMTQDWSKTNSSIASVLKKSKDIMKVERDIAQARKLALKHQKEYDDLMAAAVRLGKQLTPEQRQQAELSKTLSQEALKKLDADQKSVNALKSQLSLTQGIWGSFKKGLEGVGMKFWGMLSEMPGYLNDADKSIRELNLSLGNSGSLSGRLQDQMLAAGEYSAKFGMTVRDQVQMQAKYTEMTGKINTMSAQNSKWMTLIAKGTGLGADAAAEMAGHFEIMGVNASTLGKDIENIVNQSQEMGVNATNVLKNMNANFARSQDFTFVHGRQGLKDMAMNAEKMKISMESTFAAADKARTLKGSLDMASQLMVMGGNFAKADPFQLSFLSRNDPAKFQETLANMTKGMASFNRETGELSVSAYDMDRLRQVSEATNIPLSELKASALELQKISMAKSSLFVGSDSDKEMIARMSTMHKDGSFTVNVGGADVALNKLSASQISMLKAEKSTLEARARDAQAFDEVYKGFIMQLKATALPLIKMLTPFLASIKDVIDKMSPMTIKLIAGTVAAVGGITAAMVSLGPLASGLKAFMSIKGMFSGGGGGGKGFFGRMFSGGGGSAASGMGGGGGGNMGGGAGGGGMGKLAAGGSSAAATLAAVGVAAVGMGYGIKLATEGISKLAQAMKGMTGPEVAGLVGVVAALSIGFAAMAIGVASFANPASLAGVAVVGGLALTMIGMGYAIKLATDGVANMFQSMSSLAGLDLSAIGGFFGAASNFLAADDSNFGSLIQTVETLKNAQSSILTEMREIMNTPITLQLAGDNKMVVNVEVNTTDINGDKFVKKFTKPFSVELQKATRGLRALTS